MKRLAILLSLLFVSFIALMLGSKSKPRVKISHDHEGELDENMTGPKGEDIFIGAGGGRYFMKDDRKIYVGYKTKKPHL